VSYPNTTCEGETPSTIYLSPSPTLFLPHLLTFFGVSLPNAGAIYPSRQQTTFLTLNLGLDRT